MALTVQKKQIRITLDLEVYDDFNPKEIKWEELLKIEGDECVYASVKEYDDPRSW